MKSELLWVSVPSGITERGGAREAVLRVLIAPRLQGSSLAAEGMEHWPPQALVEATLAIDFCKTMDDDLHTVNVPPPHIQVQSSVWETFFGPNMTLKPFQPQTGDDAPPIEVANTSAQASAIQTTFDQSASSKISVDPATRSEFDRVVREQLKTHWLGDEPVPVYVGQSSPPSSNIGPPDFHRTISMLREHPSVLRALGLIFELRVPVSELPREFSEGLVRVHLPNASALPALPAIVSPWTRYDSAFRPGSTDNISSGMVTLNGNQKGTDPNHNGEPRWQVVIFDVDGGSQRLRDAARTLVATPMDGATASDETTSASLPALRSAGLLLIRRGRQQDFAARRQGALTNARRESMATAVLTADDLLLGYRVDIKHFGGDWFSLMQREATYRVGENTIIGIAGADEEGHVKAHAAVRETDGRLRTDEVVTRWSGWSLAVPRPTLDDYPHRPRPAPRPGLPFKFSLEFYVKNGTLPRLRFTNNYHMRARVADIAGGGLELDDPAADRCATEPVLYQRYEPILSPDIVLPEGMTPIMLGPAETLDQVVIRSDPLMGMNVAQFAEQNPQYTSYTGRILLPPRTSVTLAEQHGVLDGDVEQTWAWVQRAMALAEQTGIGPSEASLPDPAAGGVTAFPRREPGGPNANLVAREWSEPWPELKPKSLELSERLGTDNIIEWQGEQLDVRLAPAEEVILELSTFVHGDYLDHFAAKKLLPQEAETAALIGRHPMLTPIRLVHLVHAVRRPLSEPRGELQAQRKPSQTFALLNPKPALLNIDAPSTAKLEISGSWSEYNDETFVSVSNAPVQEIIINRDDQALKETLRHEFGDTQHRMVTYTLTAVSRFRQFFFHPDELTQPDKDSEAFVTKTTFPVNVPSSARPTPPVVLSTSPAFTWEESRSGFDIQRQRHGGRLRVELQRPWHQTGEGEMLAVVVRTDDVPPPELWPFVTQIGKDPIWDTALPEHWPTQQVFVAASGPSVMALLPEAGREVMIVPYKPWFHDGRWFADITLPAAANSSYCPFVQLAAVRYQPNSIKDLELSQVVQTEKVTLLPDRTLTVSQDFGGPLSVLLEGLGPAGPRLNRVDVIVEQAWFPPGMLALASDLTALASAPSEIPAWVQYASASGNLGSKLSVKTPIDGPLRVRVREVELIGPDDVIPEAQTGTGAELTERTVFTDMLPLFTLIVT